LAICCIADWQSAAREISTMLKNFETAFRICAPRIANPQYSRLPTGATPFRARLPRGRNLTPAPFSIPSPRSEARGEG
jgi:hypothetical protein